MSTATYNPLAKYWVVYQYSPSDCPHIFTTDDLDEMREFLDDVPARIILAGTEVAPC